MTSKRELATRLAPVTGFENPRVDLEQYATPAELAATLVHTAGLQGDIGSNLVVDLGCGTGMLALASAVAGASSVVGIDIDADALLTAQNNWRRVDPGTPVSWIRSDVTQLPLQSVPDSQVTVVMNPPFGAQNGNEHADRPFLRTAATIADVSYSIHNAGSAAFVESFTADLSGEMTHAFEASLELPNKLEFHSTESHSITAEVFRIVW